MARTTKPAVKDEKKATRSKTATPSAASRSRRPVGDERVGRLRQVLELLPEDVDGLLVTTRSNVRYLSGFTGSAGCVLITRRETRFFTDFRYQEQSRQEIGNVMPISIYKKSQFEAVQEYLAKHRNLTIGVEGALSIESFDVLLKGKKAKYKLVKGIIEMVRRQKNVSELEHLRRAFTIADKAFAKLLPYIKPGKTEIEIAARLEFLMRELGSEGPSFDSIVAAGERSACPHAQPTDRKLKAGEMVKIDFGAISGGYHSDMTRTVFLGKATPKFREVYNTVLTAQQKAVNGLKAGVECKAVDALARNHIKKAGYGESFGHGLGHSLGLDIHEAPRLSELSEDVVRVGMVFTVEPGIYLPGWGGVRIEDVYVVTDDGLERLTHTPNALLELK